MAKKPGRPRSELARNAIIETTARLLEDTPIRELSIEGIAREAGVGKPTIYRWWDHKCLLVMDAFFETTAPKVPFPKSRTLAAALRTHLKRVTKLLRGRPGRIVAEMVGEGQSNPEALERFRERFFSQLLAPAREAIEQAKATGECRSAADTTVLLDLLYGPICYRLMVAHGPLTDEFANQIADTVIPMVCAPAD